MNLRHGLGDGVEDRRRRLSGWRPCNRRRRPGSFEQVGRHGAGAAGGEFGGELRIGRPRRRRSCCQASNGLGARPFSLGEVGLSFGERKNAASAGSRGRLGGVDELGAALAVALGGAGDFGDALADDGLGDDDLGRPLSLALALAMAAMMA
jgi:hypothetical protein